MRLNFMKFTQLGLDTSIDLANEEKEEGALEAIDKTMDMLAGGIDMLTRNFDNYAVMGVN
jgi:hypothetical protein